MIQPEGRPQPGRLLLYVTIALVTGLLVLVPGIGDKPDPDDRSFRPAPVQLQEGARLRPDSAAPVPAPTTTTPAAGLATPAGASAVAPVSPGAAGGGATPGTVFSWPSAPPAGPPRPVPVPATGAYLGAYHDPFSSNGDGSITEILSNLPAFNQQIGRNLAIVHVFQPWADGWVLNENLAEIADSQGAIPMVSWRCGDTNERIVAGADDELIFRFAYQLRDYARPVILRWFWEANLLHGQACLGSGKSTEEQASLYRTAFQRIYTIFRTAGANNVAFAWVASTAQGSPLDLMDDFYPGTEYVDWVGADGYSRQALGEAAFETQFRFWYDLFQGEGKPMMVAETGAQADLIPYLDGIARDVPSRFPHIKALVYFDAVGNQDWRLSSQGGGIEAFATLGRDPHFTPMPAAP